MAQSKTFGRLLKMAVNGIATYESKNAPVIEEELGRQIGLSVAAIQRYKSGHIPPEARTVQILAEAAVQRGRLDRRWLEEFLHAAQHPAPMALIQHLFPPLPAPLAVSPAAAATLDRNRSRMLEKVYAFWIEGVLKQSLHDAALIELGLQERPDAVTRPWDAVVQQPERPARRLLAGTPLINVFDELDQVLLLLGAPGAGKTTMLLELARDLLGRAHDDPQHAIPVVFNLSTWNGQHSELDAWLVNELHLRYQVPRRLSRQWVDNAHILPLLDGLDEVSLEQRPQCVAAINRFRQEHGFQGMAVASRSVDYELLGSKLHLHGAVLIQPLSAAQIEHYLEQGGAALAGVRLALREDAALRELAETPLMLSIMSLAYQGDSSLALEQAVTVDERRHQLFETYIQRMFERRSAAAPAAPPQVRRWLGWLAQQMHSRAQTVFFIEGLQPGWLPGPRQRLLFSAATGAVMGVLSWLLGMLGMAALFVISTLTSTLLGTGDAMRALAVLPALLALTLAFVGMGMGIRARTRRAVQWALAVGGGGVGLTLLMLFLWSLGDIMPDLATWFLGLVLSLWIGSVVGVLGSLLRMARGDDGETTVKVVETLHWSRRRAVPGFIGGMLLGQGLGFGLGWLSAPLVGPSLQLLTAMVLALIVGLSLGLLGGLVSGLVGNELDLRTRPNQGIHESARYTLRGMLAGPLVTLVLGPILGGGLFLSSFFSAPNYFFAAVSAFSGSPSWQGMLMLLNGPLMVALALAAIAPVLGALIALASGGAACLQHAVLRLMLMRQRAMPYDYARFLDYAAERLFLRKVGGGYIFVHRLLLDHFAATDGQVWADVSSRSTVELLAPAAQPTIRLADEAPRAGRLPPSHGEASLERWRGLAQRWPTLERIGGLVLVAGSTVMLAGTISLSALLYTPSANLVQTLHGQAPLAALALPPAGDEVAAVGLDGRFYSWTLGNDTQREVVGEAVAPQQTVIYYGSNTVDGKTFAMVRLGPALAPDGASYVTTNDIARKVELRRSSDGTLLQAFPGLQAVFAPDGQTLAVYGLYEEGLQLWRVSDGALLHSIPQHFIGPEAVAFSPDGTLLATSSFGTLELWDVHDGTLLHSFDLFSSIRAIAIAPDKQTLALARNDEMHLLRIADGALSPALRGHDNSILSVAFSPDGRTLASGGYDRTVRLWRASDGALLQVLRGHMAEVTALAFSTDGRTLASSSIDRTVRLWQGDWGLGIGDWGLGFSLQPSAFSLQPSAFNLLPPDSCILYSVFRLLTPVFCILYSVFRLLTPDS